MKKMMLTLSLVAGTFLMADDALKAQVALTAGYNKFDSASSMESTLLYGVRATIYENEVQSYGLQVGYEGNIGIAYENRTNTTDIHRLFTHLIADGEEEYGVTPYILLGLGYEYLTDEIKGELSQGFADFGIGFRYFFAENFNTSLESRVVGKFNTRDLDIMTNLGFGYMFGGKHSKKVEPIVALSPNTKAIDDMVPVSQINDITIANQAEDGLTDMEIYNEEVSNNQNGISHEVTTPRATYTATAATGSYYVQMAAYRHTATHPLMSELSAHGIHNTSVHKRGGLSRILVGPYANRYEVRNALENLKRIRSDAFVYVMK